MTNPLLILREDFETIPYRKSLNKITGSVTATILLQQMIYWGVDKNGNAVEFYKFKEPCQHKLYKKGDSWCEELGFTAEMFETIIKKIGFKKGTPPQGQVPKDEQSALVTYYTDSSRLTRYTVNVGLLDEQLKSVYLYNTETTSETTSSDSKSEEEETLKEEKQIESEEQVESGSQLNDWLEAKRLRRENKGKWKQQGYRPPQPSQPTKPTRTGTVEDSLRDTLPVLMINGVPTASPEIKALALETRAYKSGVLKKKQDYIDWINDNKDDPKVWGLDMTTMVKKFIRKAIRDGEIEENIPLDQLVREAGYEIT